MKANPQVRDAATTSASLRRCHPGAGGEAQPSGMPPNNRGQEGGEGRGDGRGKGQEGRHEEEEQGVKWMRLESRAVDTRLASERPALLELVRWGSLQQGM